jgi:hypothetical protein
MNLREALRKGLHLLLLSFGVSAPAQKPQPERKRTAQPGSGKPGQDSNP